MKKNANKSTRNKKMLKKLTITVEPEVYHGLYAIVGAGNISQMINDTIKPLVDEKALIQGYKDMAADEERNEEAKIFLAAGAETIRNAGNVWE